MANELTIALTLNFIKAGSQSIAKGLTDTIDVAGTYTASAVQLIGTTDETLTFPSDLASVGYCIFENLDATNYLEIGSDGTNYPIRLKAGEIAMLRFNGTIHAKANTAACKLGFTIIEA